MITLLSGGDQLRLRSAVNHRIYAAMHGFDYRIEGGPFSGLLNRFYFKLEAVKQALVASDWVIWLDDDAFVTDFEQNTFTDLIARAEANGKMLVIADSPTNVAGKWTLINTGVWAIRGVPAAHDLLTLALSVTTEEVESWWRPEHGYFTKGDQDAMLWAIETGGFRDGIDIVDHALINARPYEYGTSLTDRFICHFPGVSDKLLAIDQFAARFGLDDTLTPSALQVQHGLKPARSLNSTSVRLRRAKRKLAKAPRRAAKIASRARVSAKS